MNVEAHRTYHAHLLGRMADVLGLDLRHHLDPTRVSRTDIEQAISRCSRCPVASDCDFWLDENDAGARAIPRHCQNKSLLECLLNGY